VRNVEAYVDDVVIKTQKLEDLISDLAETFDNLRKFSMKLNLERCTFACALRKVTRVYGLPPRNQPQPREGLGDHEYDVT
jgi:hypothetical protein